MATKMWTVESGSYSDHRVHCVCRTKAQAEALVAAYNGESEYGSAVVGELPIVTKVEHVTTYTMSLDIWDDGAVSTPFSRTSSTAPIERVKTELSFDMLHPFHNQPVTWRWVRAPVHDGKGGRLDVVGTDQERVRKVFSDRKVQLLAEDVFRMRSEAKG